MRRDDGPDIDIAFHEARLTLRDGTPVLIRRIFAEDAPEIDPAGRSPMSI